MRCTLFISIPVLLLSTSLSAQSPPTAYTGSAHPQSSSAEVERIVANDNRQPAGHMENAVLVVRLNVVNGTFRPEKDDGSSLPALAFAETGKPASIPGPIIRAARGTTIRVIVSNPFKDSTLTVHGLQAHRGEKDQALQVPPGETRETEFRAGSPGTYYYWATTGNRPIAQRVWFESQLSGAFVIDHEGAPLNDRVFVIGIWEREVAPSPALPQTTMVINGKSWPNTERFSYTQGDSVHWRWINPTSASHPMHLHGFYYRVESRGDGMVEHPYQGDARPFVVTDLILPGRTMRMSWVPERPGNWVFHCHFAFHVSHHMMLPSNDSVAHSMGGNSPVTVTPHRMAGLVLGINVSPSLAPHQVKVTSSRAREIRLVAQSAPRRFGSVAGMGYVVQNGTSEPRRDSILIPGPLLLLKRGEPVRITVVNHLSEPTAVHWHGIELESFPDGVPGWSGTPGRIMPPIAPADSFAAEFVPPRAGTFIYHTHSNEQLQMGSGLYGPLLVVDEGHPFNPEIDRIILVGGAGPADSLPQLGFESPGIVNGSAAPPPMDLKVGKTYRLRLININPDWRVIFSLMSESALATWRPLAKDGADLPASQRRLRPAYLLTGPGETADFEFTPSVPGELRLEVKTMLPGWIIPIVVNVK